MAQSRDHARAKVAERAAVLSANRLSSAVERRICPRPPNARELESERRWRALADEKRRRLGVSRREFAESACGMAAALFVINQMAGCGGEKGGYAVTPGMMEDEPEARTRLGGDEFIVDLQVHASTPLTPFSEKAPPERALDLIHQIFVQSDTAVACISGVPEARTLGMENVEARVQLRALLDRLGGPRLLLHANADPERGASELDYIAMVASRHPVAAFKVYPHRGRTLAARSAGRPSLRNLYGASATVKR